VWGHPLSVVETGRLAKHVLYLYPYIPGNLDMKYCTTYLYVPR